MEVYWRKQSNNLESTWGNLNLVGADELTKLLKNKNSLNFGHISDE